MLISNDGVRWGWPGGRPEGDESWEQTLRREILEETCAVVSTARLLGFCRALCGSGPEQGRVLVRSILRAEITLLPWQRSSALAVCCWRMINRTFWMRWSFFWNRKDMFLSALAPRRYSCQHSPAKTSTAS